MPPTAHDRPDVDCIASEATFHLTPDDRIGPAPRRRFGRRLMVLALLLAAVAGGGAWLSAAPGRTDEVWSSLTRGAAGLWSLIEPADRPEAASVAGTTASPAQPSADDREGPPGPAPTGVRPEPAPDASPIMTAALPANPPPAVEEPAATPRAAIPYEDPARDPAPVPIDRYRRRAEAVGLHPDISRDLLERLSEADYRNAAIAIARALSETPDDAVLIWPTHVKSGLAQFEVRFVPGAGSGCRRYVVAISKAGWQTTAPALETCGARRTAVKRG